jgi:hypothetical protein
LTTYTKPALPVGLERALRELGARSGTHPDEVVDLTRNAGMFLAVAVSSGLDERDELLARIARDKVLTIAELACACSVEVRPTNEYHPCMCWAGSVVRKLERFLDNVERKARANITVG